MTGRGSMIVIPSVLHRCGCWRERGRVKREDVWGGRLGFWRGKGFLAGFEGKRRAFLCFVSFYRGNTVFLSKKVAFC